MTLLLISLLADCLLLLLPPGGQGPCYRILERRTQCFIRVLSIEYLFLAPFPVQLRGWQVMAGAPCSITLVPSLCLPSPVWAHAVSTPGNQPCCGDKLASIPFWHSCVQWVIWPCVPKVAHNGHLLCVVPTTRSCLWSSVVPAFTGGVEPILMYIQVLMICLVDSFVAKTQ